MFEIIKFKLILKKNKNVFSDIINDMTIKTLKDNIITFVDSKENEIIAEINDSTILFRFDDKKYIIVNLPHDNNDEYVKVIDVIKEERENGCIIEVLEKYYYYTIESEDEKVLVDLISNRYVFDKNISIDDISNFEQLCKMKTTFESHLKTLLKPIDFLRWYTDSIYSTYTKINGEDISYLYDIVEGTDKIYRIYDLYNGTINERNSNDIFSIHLGLLRKSAFGYKEINGINANEKEICGDCKKKLSSLECSFIYNLINKKIGYKKQFDIYDINSIIDAITYENTATEIAKDFLERELGIPYETFEKLDFDEQYKILQEHKKILKSSKKDEVNMILGSGEHSFLVKVKKGEKVMLSDGTFVEAGLTKEESKRRLDDKIDDMLYSKPVALVKKIGRKIKNNF
jgi:hypothetical protein